MAQSSFLESMAAKSRQRAEELVAHDYAAEFTRRIRPLPAARVLKLDGDGFDIIAEIKRRSPSAGVLADEGASVSHRARAYQIAGAAAVSVLTEPSAFGGSLTDLDEAAGASQCPTMRKDFLVHPVQVLEARAHGASGVLLIVRLLNQSTMARTLDTVAQLGMFALLEVFTADDVPALERALEYAVQCGAIVYPGVNCRDLDTLEVDQHRHAELLRSMPGVLPIIAESGVACAADVAKLAQQGYRAALIGTALMRGRDAGAALRELLVAGRDAANVRMSS